TRSARRRTRPRTCGSSWPARTTCAPRGWAGAPTWSSPILRRRAPYDPRRREEGAAGSAGRTESTSRRQVPATRGALPSRRAGRGPRPGGGHAMRELPLRPDLDQLRRQARDLRRAAAAGDEDAVRRLRAVSTATTLSAAQLAL